MLHVQNLRKSYGATTVLDGISFVLNDGEHIGLIGANGTGKSTLLRCLVGAETPDEGSIVVSPATARVGHLPQAFAEHDSRTVRQVVEDAQADFQAAEHRLQTSAESLSSGADLAAYDAALAAFESLGGYAREAHAATVLDGLGLADVDLDAEVRRLSGGQKTRLGLAALLLTEPDLMLLDEPTNHLDLEALKWLEGFLNDYPRAALVVSHDRVFLDSTVSRVLYLDAETRQVKSYVGGYSDFAAARTHERELQEQTWRQQEEYIGRVRADIGRLKSQARSIENSTTAREPGLRKFARRKAAVARSRERKLEHYLASDERVERPKPRWAINLDFGVAPPAGRVLLTCEDLAFAYPGGPLLFEHLRLEVRYGQRLAITGPNGSGKTTLLRLIAGDIVPLAGSVRLSPSARVGLMAQEQETLDPELSVLETVLRARPMSEQDARSFLPYFLFYGDAVFKKVGACSLGERSRLQLARLVLQGCNLLLLDEPLNHLDLESREHFEAALEAFDGAVIAVAHDRAFLRSFARRTLELSGTPANSVTNRSSLAFKH